MKLIKMTANAKETAIAEFDKKVAEARAKLESSDRLTQAFEFKFEPPTDLTVPEEFKATLPRPQIVMSAATYLKMLQYVLQIDIECAWHGFVTRTANIFAITDTKMYPHKGRAAYVESDETKLLNQTIVSDGIETIYPTIEKYEAWKLSLTTAQEMALRFQAHSHVNMGTNPSGTDVQNQKDFMNDIINFIEANPAATPEIFASINPFYIFAIMNKKQEINWFLYDYTVGVLYEKEDLDFSVIFTETFTMATLAQEIKNNHSTASIATTTTYYNTTYPPRHGSYYDDDYDGCDWRQKYPNTVKNGVTYVKPFDEILEIKCTTDATAKLFMSMEFYTTYKALLFAHKDPNFDHTYFYALDDEAAKKVVFDELRKDPLYQRTAGIILAQIARPKWYPPNQTKDKTKVLAPFDKKAKRLDKCLEKIETWIAAGGTPYILIENKRVQFDEIDTQYKNLMEMVGEFMRITFKNGETKDCFCITNILCIENEQLECILALQAAGFSFKSIKLEKEPVVS